MYTPKHFVETRSEVLQALMRAHPLATIVVADHSGLAADHIPLLWRASPEPHGVLLGHVARANPLWHKAGNGVDCLVIFQGVSHYISPSWYASKAEHGRVVPTWNYAVVHVRGRLQAVDDPDWLRPLLVELTAEHESRRPVAWQLGDAPADYIKRMLQAVVGIRIEIVAIDGKLKLSQNHPPANRQSAIQALQADGSAPAVAMADAIGRGP